MSEPTDPREIRHNAGLTHNDIAEQLRNMDPKTIRERHLQTVLPRTPYDRDQVRQQRAACAVRMHLTTNAENETLRQRCMAIIRSLEHMEIDKDIALLALEKLCGVDD